MSLTLLILSILNILLFGVTLFRLRSVCAERPFFECFRESAGRAFSGRLDASALSAAGFLISLHLLVPLTGLALTLRSDYNFLPVLAGILISMQISQRVYPASSSAGEDEDLMVS